MLSSRSRTVWFTAFSVVTLLSQFAAYGKQSSNCFGPDCHDVRVWQKTHLQHQYYVKRSTGSLIHDTENYVLYTAMQGGETSPVMSIQLRNTHQPCCTGKFFHVPYMRGVNIEMSSLGLNPRTVAFCALRNNLKPAEANLNIQLSGNVVTFSLSQMKMATPCNQWYESADWANYDDVSIQEDLPR